MVALRSRIEGVVIGILLGFEDGQPLVVFAGNPEEAALKARSLVTLGPDSIASEVALLFEEADASRPLIVGRIIEPIRETQPRVVSDGRHVRIHGEERVELRCGKATIILEKDGHITIRGTYVTSHASAKNHIRGGSVNLN